VSARDEWDNALESGRIRAFHILELEKAHQHWREGQDEMRCAFITFHAACFGLLVFLGHIGTAPKAQQTSEKVSTLENVA
jgi:hypothetical protein